MPLADPEESCRATGQQTVSKAPLVHREDKAESNVCGMVPRELVTADSRQAGSLAVPIVEEEQEK